MGEHKWFLNLIQYWSYWKTTCTTWNSRTHTDNTLYNCQNICDNGWFILHEL